MRQLFAIFDGDKQMSAEGWTTFKQMQVSMVEKPCYSVYCNICRRHDFYMAKDNGTKWLMMNTYNDFDRPQPWCVMKAEDVRKMLKEAGE